MTPHQLLERKPVHVSNDVAWLWGYQYSHVPEVSDPSVKPRMGGVRGYCWYPYPRRRTHGSRDRAPVRVTGVEVRVYKHHNFDFRRVWRLASVHVRDRPVLIVRNGGREGDDEASRYVFDLFLYAELVELLGKLPRDRRYGYPKTRVGWSSSEASPYNENWVPCRRADEFFGGRNLDSPPEWWEPYI
jgi:hypothetical protein